MVVSILGEEGRAKNLTCRTSMRRESAWLVAAFAVLWSLGKGCLNQNAFAYPRAGTGVAPTFTVFLLVSVVTALLAPICMRKLGARPRAWFVIAALFASFGIFLLVVFDDALLNMVGAVLAGMAMVALQIVVLAALMREPAGLLLIAVGFAAGDALCWLYSAPVERAFLEYLFCVLPFVAVFALMMAMSRPPGDRVCEPGSTGRVLRAVSTPLLGFLAFATVSIAISHLFMAQSSVSENLQTLLHLVAPLTGSSVFLVLTLMGKSRIPLVPIVYLIAAFALLPLPFLGLGYLEPMKVFTMAVTEALFVFATVSCAEAVGEYGASEAAVASVLVASLSFSTLLGALIGTACEALGDAAVTSYLIVEVVSFCLLLVTATLIAIASRARKNDVPLVVRSDGRELTVEAAADAAARQCGLTLREREVLEHLLRQESPAQIADGLVLSLDTVRGHIKNIYRKADVHSRRELELKAGECGPDHGRYSGSGTDGVSAG